jgi:hypothetical protein
VTDLAIRNYDELMSVAKLASLSELMPRDLRGKPGNIGIIMLYGHDLGLSPMQAIQGIYVVEGRPSLSAQTWLALTRRAKHKVSVLEHTGEKCAVKIVRGDTGEEHTHTYTLEDAVRAGRVSIKDGEPWARSQQGKPLPWETNTKAMLLARAVSACARFICPEVALGFYAEDEVEEAAETLTAAADVVRQQEATEPEPDEPVDAEVIQGELADIAAGYAEEPA